MRDGQATKEFKFRKSAATWRRGTSSSRKSVTAARRNSGSRAFDQGADQVKEVTNLGADWYRDIVEQGLNQSRAVLEGYMSISKKAVEGVDRVGIRSIRIAQETLSNAYDLAHKLLSVRGPHQLASLQTEFVRRETEIFSDQLKDAGADLMQETKDLTAVATRTRAAARSKRRAA